MAQATQTASRTSYWRRASAFQTARRAKMLLFQTFSRPSHPEITDCRCIKDGTPIDPPYNTGNDFIYEDNFSQSAADYADNSGQTDEEGNRLVQNSESNGRFHTDWLNMLYPRLRIAKDLLSEDGVIFISIDDHEQENMKKICDEVFGRRNFVAQLVWEKKKKGAFLSKSYINMKEYILVFCKKNISFNGLIGEITTEEGTYPCIKTTNARGIRIIRKGTPSKYKDSNYAIASGTRVSSGNMELIYLDNLVVKDGVLEKDVKIDSNWIYSQEKLDEYSEQGLVYITRDNYIRHIVNDKRVKMLKDLLSRIGADGVSLPTFKYDDNLNNGGWGTNEDANDELHHLLGGQYIFDFSKPTRLLAKLAVVRQIKCLWISQINQGGFSTMRALSAI